jgi:hypothetical protein
MIVEFFITDLVYHSFPEVVK